MRQPTPPPKRRRSLVVRAGQVALLVLIAVGVSLFVDLRSGLLRHHVPLALVLALDGFIVVVVVCVYVFGIRRDLRRAADSPAAHGRGSRRSRRRRR
jgi:uncharacterized YccA/Bax inhibitor family protein